MNWARSTFSRRIARILRRRPDAVAILIGSSRHPKVQGSVHFYQTGRGTLVAAEAFGLPYSQSACATEFFAFHIHEGTSCGSPRIVQGDPFPGTLSHYNPGGCPHPHHAGDLPPLIGNDGYAVSIFLTDRFSVSEVIERTVVIHAKADDFITQPAGGAGEKIACGEIRRV